MEERYFELMLPDKRKAVWLFRGEGAAVIHSLLHDLVTVAKLPDEMPVASTVIVDFLSVPVESHDNFSMVIDKECRHVAIRIGKGKLLGNASDVALARWIFLSALYPLVRHEEVLPVHGALLCRDEAGVIVGGPSGAGKSTCARRVTDGWSALSEDWCLITRVGDEYFAQGLPTWSNRAYRRQGALTDINRHVRLSAGYRIRQDDCDRIETMPKMEQRIFWMNRFADLFYCWNFHASNPLRQKVSFSALNFVSALSTKIEARELKCTLHGRFWNELEKQEIK